MSLNPYINTVYSVAHTEHVWKCQKQSACWLQSEGRVQCESGYSQRKPSPKISVQDVPGKTCMQMTCMVIITDSLEELQQKLMLWKTNMEGKGLQVNIGKTKVLISGPGLGGLQKTGKKPWGRCLKGLGTKSCAGCASWVQSTKNVGVSLDLWSLMPASGVNSALHRPDQ